MKFICHILFVSYLKNKGVRRLSFVIGILLSLFVIKAEYSIIREGWFSRRYDNLEKAIALTDFKSWYYVTDNKVFTVRQEIYKKYFEGKFSNIRNYEDFDNIFYKDRLKNPTMGVIEKCRLGTFIEGFDETSCEKLKKISQGEIAVTYKDQSTNSMILLSFISLWIVFYLPFIFAIILKWLWLLVLWIYQGFKESDNKERDNVV